MIYERCVVDIKIYARHNIEVIKFDMIVRGAIKSASDKRGVSVNGRVKAILNPEVMYAK